MGVVLTSLGIIFIFVGVGGVFTLFDGDRRRFKYARVCFVAAGLDMIGLTAYWLYGTGFLAWRVVEAATICVAAVVAMVGANAWVGHMENAPRSSSRSPD